ncbi:hypothetical protein HDU76_008923 [Blyttiomyces sp. JEL0837]|nr:hypothetical protein HDU76_008923 [Blyttiomyces sp. JEL0837]
MTPSEHQNAVVLDSSAPSVVTGPGVVASASQSSSRKPPSPNATTTTSSTTSTASAGQPSLSGSAQSDMQSTSASSSFTTSGPHPLGGRLSIDSGIRKVSVTTLSSTSTMSPSSVPQSQQVPSMARTTSWQASNHVCGSEPSDQQQQYQPMEVVDETKGHAMIRRSRSLSFFLELPITVVTDTSAIVYDPMSIDQSSSKRVRLDTSTQSASTRSDHGPLNKTLRRRSITSHSHPRGAQSFRRSLPSASASTSSSTAPSTTTTKTTSNTSTIITHQHHKQFSFRVIETRRTLLTAEELSAELHQKLSRATSRRQSHIRETITRLRRRSEHIKYRLLLLRQRERLNQLKLRAKTEYSMTAAAIKRQLILKQSVERCGAAVERAQTISMMQKLKRFLELRRAFSESFTDLLESGGVWEPFLRGRAALGLGGGNGGSNGSGRGSSFGQNILDDSLINGLGLGGLGTLGASSSTASTSAAAAPGSGSALSGSRPGTRVLMELEALALQHLRVGHEMRRSLGVGTIANMDLNRDGAMIEEYNPEEMDVSGPPPPMSPDSDDEFVQNLPGPDSANDRTNVTSSSVSASTSAPSRHLNRNFPAPGRLIIHGTMPSNSTNQQSVSPVSSSPTIQQNQNSLSPLLDSPTSTISARSTGLGPLASLAGLHGMIVMPAAAEPSDRLHDSNSTIVPSDHRPPSQSTTHNHNHHGLILPQLLPLAAATNMNMITNIQVQQLQHIQQRPASPLSAISSSTGTALEAGSGLYTEPLATTIRRNKVLPVEMYEELDESDYMELSSLLPPITRFTLRELDLDEILNNISLRHDLYFDPHLQFKPNTDGERGEIKRQRTNAYWSEVSTELSNNHTYRIPLLLFEIKNIIIELLPYSESMQEDVEDNIDVRLVAQQLRHGVFQVGGVMGYLAGLLKANCAPARDGIVEGMLKAGEEGRFVDSLKFCFELLEMMKLDYANHQLLRLRPYVMDNEVEFEWTWFKEEMEQGNLQLEATKSFITGAFYRRKAVGAVIKPSYIPTLTEVYIDAITHLIQHSAAIGNPDVSSTSEPGSATSARSPAMRLPETLSMDLNRLTLFRNDWQDITIMATLLILYRQAGGSSSAVVRTVNSNGSNTGSPSSTTSSIVNKGKSMSEMKDTLWILLNDNDSETSLSHIVLEIARSAGEARGKPFTEMEISTLNGLIERTLAPNSKLYELVWARIGEHLMSWLVKVIEPQVKVGNGVGVGSRKVVVEVKSSDESDSDSDSEMESDGGEPIRKGLAYHRTQAAKSSNTKPASMPTSTSKSTSNAPISTPALTLNSQVVSNQPTLDREKLAKHGLAELESEILDLADRLGKLVELNRATYFEVYKNIYEEVRGSKFVWCFFEGFSR